MLSKKLTFSLTSFVALIAFGLVCFVPSVMADGDANETHYDLTVVISAAESMIDVSHEGDDAKNIQIASGRDRTSRFLTGAGDDAADALAITLLVEFSHVVNLALPAAPADPLVKTLTLPQRTSLNPLAVILVKTIYTSPLMTKRDAHSVC